MASPPSPQFVLRLVDGRGVLGLAEPIQLPLGQIDRLDLEVPKLRFPFEGSGEATRFRNRRCTVRDAALRIDEEQIARWLESRPLARYGIEELTARLSGDRLQIAGGIVIADRRASFTCIARLVARGTALRLELDDLRTYQLLPAPAPLVGLALLYALGARPSSERQADRPPGFSLHGIDAMEVDALSLALWRSLLPSGWRLPLAKIEAPRIESDGRALVITFEGAIVAAPDVEDLVEADERLAAGDLAGALAMYEAAGDDPQAIDRRLATLTLMPERLDEAIALGESALANEPERGARITLVATLLVERGRLDDAIELFRRASVLAERNGEPGAAIAAALRAAELLLTLRPTEATPLLERVVAGRPSHRAAAAMLADRLAAEDRGPELLRLEKRRLSQARGQREEAEARLRLGAVWLDHQGDALRARDELERALRLFPGDAATFRLYARALDASGEATRALEAIEHALALDEAGSRRADRVFAATLCERVNRLADAQRHAEELLEESPGDAEGLELLARIAVRAGKLDDAIAAYDRAASAALDEMERGRLYFEIAQLCLQSEGTRAKARVFLARAIEAHPTLEVLHVAAALADGEQRYDDLDGILARLGALGDRDARVRRVRILLATGKASEAAAEAEALAMLGDAASLELLVEVRRVEGRGDAYRTALERFVDASRSPGPRIELGKLRAEAGELARARILLEEALTNAADGDRETERAALDVLCDVLMRQGDDASVEVALGRLAALREDAPSRALALAAQGAARVRLGRVDQAMASYRDALVADPTDTQARLGLAEAAHSLRLWDDARAALEPLHDAAPRADRALRLGEIAERQNRAVDAIRFYESALEVGASGSDAQRVYVGLASLHHARGEWEAEARVLLRAAEDARTPENDAARATRLVHAADLLRKRVGRLDEALALYDRALALESGNLPALDALEAIAMEREDWARAAQILSRKVAATSKRPNEQKAILGRLAVLQAEKLGREDAAREAYGRVLAIDPSFRAALIFLARDARARCVAVEEMAHLEKLTSLAADPAEPDARLADLARLAQLQLAAGRADDAEPIVRRVLNEQPRHPLALAVLDELLTRGNRTTELEALLDVRAQIASFDDALELTMRRGALVEAAGRTADAIAAYEHVTGLRPNHIAAWTRLADLFRRTQAWAPLAIALGRIADWHAAESRAEEAATLYVEQAHVLHDQLGDAERARVVLERAREVWPTSRLVLGALLALARGRGDATTEGTLLEQLVDLEPDPTARAIAVLERARAMEARGDVEGALKRLRELSSAHAPAAALKLRVELEERAGTMSAATEVLDRLREQAQASGDEQGELFVLERLLKLSRGEAIARRIVELDPTHRAAQRVLADAAGDRRDAPAQVAALEKILDGVRRRFEGAAAEAELLVELGAAASERGDAVAATAYLREAVDATPEDARARLALGRHLARQGSDVESALHLGRAAELGALTPDDHLLLADAYERLGQTQRAAASVLAAGSTAPAGRRALAASRLGNDVEARGAALSALADDATDQDALRVLLRGLSPAALIAQVDELAPKIGSGRAAALLAEHAAAFAPRDARLALERAIVLEPTAARLVAYAQLTDDVTAYERALELDPSSTAAALGVARLSPERALAVLREALDRNEPSRETAPLALKLGELLRDRGDIPEALPAFQRAFDDANDDALRVDAARALATTARAAGDATRAESALRALIETDNGDDRDLRMLAELLIERAEYADAIELLDELDAPGALYALALERAGERARLVDHLEHLAQASPRLEARAQLVRASALAEELGDPKRAMELLERALPLGPADGEIWERLGSLRAVLGHPEGAAQAFARAYSADPKRAHLLIGLADYHYAAEEWTPARDYYASALANGSDELFRIHARLAQIARRGADALTEEHHLRLAVDAQPDAGSLRRLVEIYRVREDKLRLEQALMVLADVVPADERLPLLREARELMGAAPLAELDERILTLDRSDEAARSRVLSRLRSVEDPSALLDRLERELERAIHETGSIAFEIPLELGRVSLERGELHRAARSFRLSIEHGGGHAAAMGVVEALRSLARLPEAAPLIEAQLAGSLTDAERAPLEHLLLQVYLEVAPERALGLIEHARARGSEIPVDAGAYRRLLRAEGRLDELLADLDARALAAAPSDRLAFTLEAAELLEGALQRPREAARRYAALFEEHPARRDLASRARALYLAAGEPIYALGLVDRELAIAAPEDAPQLKITRGEILLAAGADAEAEAEFLHALITTKRVGRAHAALADVYRKRGDLASALEHLIAAADAPDLEPARAAACAVDAADVLLVEGDTATAERLYQLATALDPADRRALDALIRLAAAQGAHERQAELLGRAATLTTDRRERARIVHERARIFETELGLDLDAYRAYREAVACDPTLRDAVRSLRGLAEARGEWAVAAEQLYREISLADDRRERSRLHLHLARIHEERLFDSAVALRNLEESAELVREDRPEPSDNPWPSLVRLYAEAQRFGDAAAAAERHLASLPESALESVRREVVERAASLHALAGDTVRAEALRDELQITHDALASLPVEEQRRAIEQRLELDPHGEDAVPLLRRLLTLLDDDLPAIDQRTAQLLERVPDDQAAFLARRRLIEARKDAAGLVALLRTRAQVVTDPRERAERRYEAGRVAETQLYDVQGAAADYEAALDLDHDHVGALEAFADLAYRTRHLQRARTLYDRLGDRSSTLGMDEIGRRRGELAEEAGDHVAARAHYAAATVINPENLGAQQALARVSMRIGDDRGAYGALRSVLELLPRDALDRAAELKRHLGALAAKLGELADARSLLESILLEDPQRRDVLTALADVYERSGAWREAAVLHDRQAHLCERSEERADLLFRAGEAFLRAHDEESASDAFLKSADLNPRHAPTLRRLVRHYLTQLDLDALFEVVHEIEALGAPLAEAALDAGLGLALRGDEARAAIVAAMSQPTPFAIVESIAALPWPVPARFDAALRTALRAAGGAAAGRDRVLACIEDKIRGGQATPAIRFALALLLEQGGSTRKARLQLEILSFLDPVAEVDAKLSALGAATLPEPTADEVVPADARGTLRDVLCDLGPLTLGLAVAPLDVEPAPDATTQAAPVAALFGYGVLDVVLLDRLADPAWAEPTQPPRILMQRRLASDPALVRFATARALHALHAGLGLIHGRAADDIASLLRAAASVFLPDLSFEGPFVRAWHAELMALGLRAEAVPESIRARLEIALATLAVDRSAGERAPRYAIAERLTANRVAYVVTGDLRAGLVALAHADADDARSRERLLHEDPAIVDLLAFASALAR